MISAIHLLDSVIFLLTKFIADTLQNFNSLDYLENYNAERNMYFTENGNTMLIDIDDKSKDEILEHLVKVVGKSKQTLIKETISQEKKDNPANFGVGCDRSCICHVPGQVPCPGIVPLPDHMRGKIIIERLQNKE